MRADGTTPATEKTASTTNSIAPFDIYENYLATYVDRDVNQIANIKNRREFNMFLRVLAGRTGQLVNCQTIANDIGVSVPTIKNWISILEACFIIATLPCYYRNFGKRFVKAPKIYFTDVGLLTHLLGIREESQIDGKTAGYFNFKSFEHPMEELSLL